MADDAKWVPLATEYRAERCHYCNKFVRVTHRVAHTGAGLCGTGTVRTVVCSPCSKDDCPHTTVRFLYRDATEDDQIDQEVENLKWWGRKYPVF